MGVFSNVDHPWSFAFGIMGNIISFMVYLAPLPTFSRICRKKSTEGFQSLPYVVALFSATLWIYYALVKTNSYLIITINTVGCVIETIYIIIFMVYAPKKARIFTTMMLLLLNVVIFGSIVLFTLIFSKGKLRVQILGWICVSFAVTVFVAPLSIIRLVIKTKSVEFMPFSLSFFLTISAITWFFYGLLTKDIYVELPNLLGFTFGVIQMVLYTCYRNSTPEVGMLELEKNNVDGSENKLSEVAISIEMHHARVSPLNPGVGNVHEVILTP